MHVKQLAPPQLSWTTDRTNSRILGKPQLLQSFSYCKLASKRIAIKDWHNLLLGTKLGAWNSGHGCGQVQARRCLCSCLIFCFDFRNGQCVRFFFGFVYLRELLRARMKRSKKQTADKLDWSPRSNSTKYRLVGRSFVTWAPQTQSSISQDSGEPQTHLTHQNGSCRPVRVSMGGQNGIT